MVSGNALRRIGYEVRNSMLGQLGFPPDPRMFRNWEESEHPRDWHGRWMVKPSSGAKKKVNPHTLGAHNIGSLDPRVSLLRESLRNKGYHLHEAVDHYHWFHGNSAVGGVTPFRRISFTKKWPKPPDPTSWYKQRPKPLPLDAQGSPYDKMKGRAERFSREVLHNLSGREHDTLHRLTYGNIPARWGRDPEYVKHLRTWAKGSKLTDAESLPWRLFHGTGSAFTQFDPGTWGKATDRDDARHAFFFSSSPEDAGFFAFYGLSELHDQSMQPNVMPVHVRLKNPLVVVDVGQEMDMKLLENALIHAEDHGFDGVVCYNAHLPKGGKFQRLSDRIEDSELTLRHLYRTDGPLKRVPQMTVCCFKPNDIKSAIGNSGEFSESPELGKGATLLLDDVSLYPSLTKAVPSIPQMNAPKEGEVISYKHPKYRSLVRKGKVICSGRDGCLVLHDASLNVEGVRHEDIVRDGDKGNKKERKEIAKSMKPAAKAKPGQQQAGGTNFGPAVHRLPFQVGHAVTYQRPDMGEPAIGRIEDHGRHGALVTRSNGARHKVRWEHVHGHAQAGIDDADRGEVVDTLRQMGLPMDELDALLTPERKPRANSQLLDQLSTLASGGAPIDTKRAANAPRSAIERLRDHLTVTSRA